MEPFSVIRSPTEQAHFYNQIHRQITHNANKDITAINTYLGSGKWLLHKKHAFLKKQENKKVKNKN